VRAIVDEKLRGLRDRLDDMIGNPSWTAHIRLVSKEISRYFDDPDAFQPAPAPEIPPGSPIGDWACEQ
jgi:hypothetical protein